MERNPYGPPREETEATDHKPFPWVDVLIWLGVLAILAAILFPAIVRAMATANG